MSSRTGHEAEVVAALRRVAGVHQSRLVRVLEDLEEVTAIDGRESLPRYAEDLRTAVWPFLAHYGRRDERGAVDDSTDDEIRAWRPGDDDAGVTR